MTQQIYVTPAVQRVLDRLQTGMDTIDAAQAAGLSRFTTHKYLRQLETKNLVRSTLFIKPGKAGLTRRWIKL